MSTPNPRKTVAGWGAWRLRWQGFWARRAGLRLNGALLFTLLALLAALYLALPSAQQQTLQQAALSAAGALGATGLTVAIEVVLAGSIVCALSLLFAPGYRYGRYLTLQSAQPAPVAVYMDGENVTEDRHIQAIVSLLRREYAHRRLDMLFFAQVAGGEHTRLHRTLYLYGFRPIQVPHDPTGTNRIREAADKEMAMHALQRALVGPAKQEFILIAKDGGYVPLVYRLAALGHSVQVWSPDPIQAYHIVRDYLKIEVVNLSKEAANMGVSPNRAAPATLIGVDAPASSSRAAAAPAPTRYTVVAPPPVEFNQPNQATRAGMNGLYYAISNTVELSRFIRSQKGAPEARQGRWFTALGNDVRDAIAAIGYSGSGYGSRWQRLLISVGALKGAGKDCPEPGDVAASEAAAQVYALALATAQAACQALPNLPEDAITMQTVSSNIQQREGNADAIAQAFVALADPRNPDRSLAIWFLLSCARGLGLMEFEVEAGSRDLIKSPRLTPLAESLVGQAQAPGS